MAAMKEIYDPRYRELVAQLRDTRKQLGLTQSQVAAEMGLCRTWVAKVECYELALDLLHFVRLCRVYRVKADQLIRHMEK